MTASANKTFVHGPSNRELLVIKCKQATDHISHLANMDLTLTFLREIKAIEVGAHVYQPTR